MDSRRIAPPDAQFLAVQGDFLDRGVGVEGRSGRAVKEGDEDARLFGKKTDILDRAESNEMQEFINGSV